MENYKFIPALTGIRFICVSFIFFIHLNPFNEVLSPTLFLITNQFYIFLDFFFVLSGFVLCYKYDFNKIKLSKELYNYYINRFSRVFPILLLLVTATYLFKIYDNSILRNDFITEYLLNISLLKGFSSTYHLSGIGPSWSLSVEELFYFLSPIIFFIAKKKASNLLAIVGITLILGFIVSTLFQEFGFAGFFSSYKFTAYSTFFGRIFEFSFGIYLAYIIKGKYKNLHLQKFGKYTLTIGFCLLLLSICALYFIAKNNNVLHAVDYWPGIIINNLIMPISIFFIFYHLIKHESFVKNILSHKIFVELGKSTYSFYLIHTTFVLSFLSKFITKNEVLLFLCITIISYCFYRIIEEPMANYLRRKFSKS